MMRQDNFDDKAWFGKYVSFEELTTQGKVNGTEKVLESSTAGPKYVLPDADKTAAANKANVWKISKGMSREDCVALEPLDNPGWFLRLTKTKVRTPSTPETKMLVQTAMFSIWRRAGSLLAISLKKGNQLVTWGGKCSVTKSPGISPGIPPEPSSGIVVYLKLGPG